MNKSTSPCIIASRFMNECVLSTDNTYICINLCGCIGIACRIHAQGHPLDIYTQEWEAGITTPSRQNLILPPMRRSVEEEVLRSSVKSSERKGRHSDPIGSLV